MSNLLCLTAFFGFTKGVDDRRLLHYRRHRHTAIALTGANLFALFVRFVANQSEIRDVHLNADVVLVVMVTVVAMVTTVAMVTVLVDGVRRTLVSV
ncbi:hypothetical protein BpHYR1_043599 [Brachionus plicatilis]|uniref:Uncharacterized protein n=1 Tax=Brachionus plicatilis TaxID=10195 RepID=A0A3M7T888_BRAPC|nr:hypothetical protein BpHYR1_043599 [Brachionus plicatilis]